jgi:hypothetical protein
LAFGDIHTPKGLNHDRGNAANEAVHLQPHAICHDRRPMGEPDQAAQVGPENVPTLTKDVAPATFGFGGTPRRAAVAWWIVFLGPALIALVALIAGVIGDRRAVLWVFPVAVWAFTLMLGVAAAPEKPGRFWLVSAMGFSFVSAAVGLAVLFGVNELSVRASEPTTTSTTTATSGPPITPHVTGTAPLAPIPPTRGP